MPKERKSRVHAKKLVHPNSRKAAKLARAAHRDDKLQSLFQGVKDHYSYVRNLTLHSQDLNSNSPKKKAERTYLVQIKAGEKFRWFFENIDQDKTQYTIAEVCDLVERYLGRFDEELQQIEGQNNIKGRQGRAHASREDAIKNVIQRETEIYHGSGIELPDFTSTKALALFKNWNCDVASLKLIKMRKFHSTSANNNKETKVRDTDSHQGDNPDVESDED